MLMKLLIFTALIFVASIGSIKAQNIFNTKYQFGKEVKTVAIVPLMNSYPEKSDTITRSIFRDTLLLKFIDVKTLRSKLDDKLFGILKKIAEIKYKNRDLKEFPNLKTILSQQEIDFIRLHFSNADLLLFPIIFNVSQEMGMTLGRSKFRLYDLSTGEFIQQFGQTINVNLSGDVGLKALGSELLAAEKAHLLENIKN